MKPKVITSTHGAPASPPSAAPPGEGPLEADGGRVLRPTVIGQGAAPAAPRPVSATVVPAAQPAASLAQPAAPRGVVPAPSTAPPEPWAVRRAPPSVVPGTIRRGVEVSAAQLAQRFPGALPETLLQVKHLLRDTVVETLSAAQAARWGDEAQRGYGELVDASLAIIHAPALQASLRHVARLHALLGAVAEQWQAPARSGLRFWKSDAGPAQALQASQGELGQLRQHLSDALPALRTLQAELQAISGQLAPLAVRLDAWGLAAQYLADTMDAAQGAAADPRAQALAQRAGALANTVLHIHSGALLRHSSQQSLDALVHRIQDTVLLALPAWMEKVALATQARALNDTERYALAQQLQGLRDLLHLS